MKKMSDVFNLPYLDSNMATIARFKDGVTLEQINQYKAHAINMHDELVALVERVIPTIKDASDWQREYDIETLRMIDELLERCK